MNAQFGFPNEESSGPSAVPEPIPTYTLFDSTSVTIATFLGSPVAGTALMALNYQRLGKKINAIAVLAIGIAVTGAAVAFGSKVPTSAGTGLGFLLLLATRSLAQYLQGAAIERHVHQGGQLASRWAAAALGAALLVIVAGVVFLFAFGQLSSKVIIGTKDEVFYSGAATKQDALALGQALKQAGYFQDRGISARISKDKDGTAVGFVLQDGMWDRPEMVSGAEELGREIAPAIGGFPIQVRLMNSAQDTLKHMTVGKAVVGTKDIVYYYGSATESEANALGQSLKSAGFFRDTGVNIFLIKDGGSTAITFVVEEGTWDMPNRVAAFEGLVRQSASAVGGLPIQLRFVNPKVELKKGETVN